MRGEVERQLGLPVVLPCGQATPDQLAVWAVDERRAASRLSVWPRADDVRWPSSLCAARRSADFHHSQGRSSRTAVAGAACCVGDSIGEHLQRHVWPSLSASCMAIPGVIRRTLHPANRIPGYC
jgi:hypothetical protein